jgi:hypothetical protein
LPRVFVGFDNEALVTSNVLSRVRAGSNETARKWLDTLRFRWNSHNP